MKFNIDVKLKYPFSSEADYYVPLTNDIASLKYNVIPSDKEGGDIVILITEEWHDNMATFSSAEMFITTIRSVEKNLDHAINGILEDMIESDFLNISIEYCGWANHIPKWMIRKKVVKQLIKHIIERSKWYIYIPHYGIDAFYRDAFDKDGRSRGCFKQIKIDPEGQCPSATQATNQVPISLLSFI